MNRHFPNVNLIGLRVSLKKVQEEKKKKVTKLSVVVLVVFLAIFIPVLVVRFVFSVNKNRLVSDVDVLTQEIAKLKGVEAKYALLNAKSTALMSLNTERIILEPKIVEVYEVMPAGTIIDDVSFGDGGDFLNVTVKAADVFAVGNLMESVSDSVGTKFTSVVIDSTKRDIDGVYKVAMELYFES